MPEKTWFEQLVEFVFSENTKTASGTTTGLEFRVGLKDDAEVRIKVGNGSLKLEENTLVCQVDGAELYLERPHKPEPAPNSSSAKS